MREAEFAVFIWEMTENGPTDLFNMTQSFFDLPRRHDIIVLDGNYFRVCEVVQHHQKPFEPELFVERLGEWEDFERSDIFRKQA